jgi:hypothetical protein
MSTTIDQIAEFLDEQDLSYGRHETEDAILLSFRIDPAQHLYRDHEGDASVSFLIRVHEEGDFLSISVPSTWNLADCPHKAAVFEALLDFQARAKLVRFDYDSDDGEVRANAEIGVEDSVFTSAQLHRLVRAVGNSVLSLDPVIRHAMRTGQADMGLLADPENGGRNPARLRSLAEEAGGVDALEKLACGEPLDEAEQQGDVKTE